MTNNTTQHTRAHQRRMNETKIGASGTPLYRFPCSCGWSGCWFAGYSNAERSFKRHIGSVRAAKEENNG